jgi:DNA polymerase III epsilon subunit-like protein
LPHPASLDLRGFVSVDVETSGPTPSRYSLLSIGACLVEDPGVTFYVELKPTSPAFVPEAMAVHRLSMDHLTADGQTMKEALASFETWVHTHVPTTHRPVFVAYNAPFDWMFVADAFDRTLGRNPFGHTALDVRSVFFGLTGQPWRDIRFSDLARRYLDSRALTHHALEDAQLQAELLQAMMAGER